MFVDLRIGTGQTGLEGGVEQAELRPIMIQGPHVINVQAWFEPCALQRRQRRTHTRLRCHTGHAVRSSIHSISASSAQATYVATPVPAESWVWT